MATTTLGSHKDVRLKNWVVEEKPMATEVELIMCQIIILLVVMCFASEPERLGHR